jgi:hypothetical protein
MMGSSASGCGGLTAAGLLVVVVVGGDGVNVVDW